MALCESAPSQECCANSCRLVKVDKGNLVEINQDMLFGLVFRQNGRHHHVERKRDWEGWLAGRLLSIRKRCIHVSLLVEARTHSAGGFLYATPRRHSMDDIVVVVEKGGQLLVVSSTNKRPHSRTCCLAAPFLKYGYDVNYYHDVVLQCLSCKLAFEQHIHPCYYA
jgi:hypothetical protein